jgi:ATP-dependent exoDNAse (exonuclease V) beta subunit
LVQNDVPQLNLYNFIEYYVQEFSVENKETDFLLNFLEMLFNYTQNAGATLKEFLKFWDDEASKISIQASENIDAVQIMTIHKAKGLEFPVVFIPMRNENSDKNSPNGTISTVKMN